MPHATRTADQRRLREALRQSEAAMAESQRVAKLGSWSFDAATNRLRWSRELFRIFDIPESRKGGPRGFGLSRVHPEDRARVSQAKARARQDGKPYELEYRVVTRAGKLKHVRETGCARKDATGRVTRLFGTVQDITRLRRTEEALRASEMRFRGVFENAGTGIAIGDRSGSLIMVNPAFADLLGYSQEELKSLSLARITHPADMKKERPFIHEILAGKRSGYELEKRYVRKNGSAVWVRLSATIVRDSSGQAVLGIGAVQDITERKQAERALQEHREMLTALLNAPTEPIVLLTADGVVLAANDAMVKRLNTTAEGLVGRCVFDLLPRDSALSRRARLRQVVRSRKPLRFDEERNGRTLDSQIYPIRGKAGEVAGVAVYSHDITDRKRAEEALQSAHDELERKVKERTAKLRALTMQLTQAEEQEQRRIARILHDDLQQILVGSRFALCQLRDGNLKSHVRQRVLNRVDENMERAYQVMRSLCMDLHPPILHELGIVAGLEWLRVDMKERFGMRVVLTCDRAAEPASASVRSFLFQAVRELLFNVVKHARVQSVRVSLKARGEEALLLEVRDSGCGFDPDQIKPTGFGLFSVRDRVDYLGGQVQIKSAPQKGTRVSITLPRM